MLKGFKERYAKLQPGLEAIMAESAPIFCDAAEKSKPMVSDPWYDIMKQVAGVIAMAATGEGLYCTTLVHPSTSGEYLDDIPLVSIHPYGVNVVHTVLTRDCNGLLCHSKKTVNGHGLVLYYGLQPFSWARHGSGIVMDSRNGVIESDCSKLWSALDGNF